jgi:hypothetical protein
MKKTFIIAVIISLMACGTVFAVDSKKYSDIESSNLMQPKAGAPNTLIFKKEGVDGKRYIKFIFDPVEIYDGKDADFGGVSKKDIDMVAGFMKSEFTRVIEGKYKIVSKPGPDVLRVKLILAGLEMTSPAMAVATRIIPFGLAMNLGKSAAGMSGSFTGSVTCAGEFYDSETNMLLYSFLTKRSPNAMDVTVVLTGLDASKKAITEIAEKFVETVDKVHSRAKR